MSPTRSKNTPAPAEAPEVEAGPTDEAQAQGDLSADEVRDRRQKAYAAGVKRLREENLEDFRRIVKEEAAKLGIEYVFQPTAAEKAKAQIEAILAEHPELAATLAPQS